MQNIRALLATRIFPPLHTRQMCTNIIAFCVLFFLKTSFDWQEKVCKSCANIITFWWKTLGFQSPKLPYVILILCRRLSNQRGTEKKKTTPGLKSMHYLLFGKKWTNSEHWITFQSREPRAFLLRSMYGVGERCCSVGGRCNHDDLQ